MGHSFRWSLIGCSIVLFVTSTQAALAQQEACPGKPNAHVIGRSTKTQPDGTIIRTTQCACNEGYSSPGSECIRTTVMRERPQPVMRAMTRPECVQFAGNSLFLGIKNCKLKPNQATLIACLKGTNLSEHSLQCLATIPAAATPLGPAPAIAACGLLVTKVPLDAMLRCKDISDSCLTNALEQHKQNVAACQR